ncbi:MAG: phosphate signaling complex protein PhoU [Pseudomonadales bacterium]|nr:phosphate signaling complex protein PhoU [Pseudomonadales bacterium]
MIDKDVHKQHISKKFNAEMDELKSHVLEMGGLVEQQVQKAITSLIDADTQLAESVRSSDKDINNMEISIDEECARILALRQPAASDLRLVIAVSKATTDLERIGDEAAKVALQAIELTEQGESPKGYIEIRHIGESVRKMVGDALDAFARFDGDAALQVVKSDKNVDREYGTAMRELVTFMMEDPRSISRVLNIMWALRSLERIGDHARNIAEYVIYLTHGKDIRHRSVKKIAEHLSPENKA